MKEISLKNKLPSHARQQRSNDCARRLAEMARKIQSPLIITSKPRMIKGRLIADAPIYLKQKGKKDKKISINELQSSWKRGPLWNQEKLGKGEWCIMYNKKYSLKKVEKLAKDLMKDCKKSMGNDVLCEPLYESVQYSQGSEIRWGLRIQDVYKQYPQIRVFLVIIPVRSQPDAKSKQSADAIYSEVKTACSRTLGVRSQCVQEHNVTTSHVKEGIIRQMFTKLGSIPWKVQFNLMGNKLKFDKPTMLVGINVNHNRKNASSPVGFSSTWDRDFVQFYSQLRYNELSDEIINENLMCSFMTKALKFFKEKNNVYPEQVILYRDGIASTQIKHVQMNEIKGIRKAFKTLPKSPKLEMLLINKRVNYRFTCEGQNTPSGLIVDNGVSSLQYWDFNLSPADAPEGCTSTPTRYVIIVDDLNLSNKKAVDEIEAFTLQLCNLYFNWPGPVRVPNVVKNAEKLTTQFGSS
eukprot:UN06979